MQATDIHQAAINRANAAIQDKESEAWLAVYDSVIRAAYGIPSPCDKCGSMHITTDSTGLVDTCQSCGSERA